MKLVELLARELSEWPSNAYVAVQDDDSDHTIWFLESDHRDLSFISGEWKCSSPFDILISRPSILASDHAFAIVTRSDWADEHVDAHGKPKHRESAKRDSDYVCWMRDRITEIEATTSALTTERAELVQKLASEGFALIGRAHDAPIGLPRDEWKVGDLVMLKCESLKTDMPVGKPLPITEFDGSSFGQDVKVDGFYFPLVSDLIWHSRPSA